MTYRILVVDDEENICFTLERFLQDEGYAVLTARGCQEAIDIISSTEFDLIFTDIMLADRSGMEILNEIRNRNLSCPVVMITGVPSVETASEAVRLGAFDYLPKPVLQKDLVRVASTALKHKAVVDEKETLRTNLKAIFKSVRDGIITVDREFKVIEINQAAEMICGMARQEFLGKSLKSLNSPSCKRCVDILRKTLDQKKMTETRFITCRREPCREQVVSLSANPLINNKGSLSGAVLVIRDETRLATLEKNLKERSVFHNIVGKNEKMQGIYALIENLANVRSTVLVTGESGTGKELVVEALHYMGVSSDKPLVKVNCGSLSENLLESELFGHVRGSFSGAVKDRVGRFQMADKGTIFLDEIGDITPKMQVALLRVLQEKEFERVGESIPIKVDVRVVAATNKNIKEEVEAGRFRQDLYYRLKVVEMRLPPLKERRDDIPLLITHFQREFNAQMDKNILGVSEDVKNLFLRYEWAGNIRELKHVMEHAFIFCRGNIISMAHLPQEMIDVPLGEEMAKLLSALKKSRWNKTKAAEILGMSRQNLYRKLKEYGIDQ
ncbi:MAG: sigma 54-interacting transcriptional regulator [Deltaproteobacteria bacterium]|uniref:sigma-54 dependent transcriptional regulator n=1 Tax=Desulfobacula sp. TaxID=2593537 RepID=UPI0019BF3122|nr:sigma 54-interacting transcriptional regulator [Candidatus Desulfobacula maris]MBL6995743.1 sigma 54-interacting transcriptional regulator [Desulfobacula sp.]